MVCKNFQAVSRKINNAYRRNASAKGKRLKVLKIKWFAYMHNLTFI
jgi:hypothetical protein